MKTRLTTGLVAVAVLATGGVADAQQSSLRVRASYFVESYTFDDGLTYKSLSEYSWPVGINWDFGRRFDLAISTGYVIVRLESAVPNQLPDQRLSGITDTEMRLSYTLVPGRLVMFGTGWIPTGIESVNSSELAILGAVSNDLLGFTTTTMGSGGLVGGGFAGTMPLGRFAVGVSGTFTNPLQYTPVTGDSLQLRPGAELRVRSGIEGALGRQTYLRAAVIWARRAQDAVGGATQNGIGNRIVGYVSLNHRLGPGSVTVYGFDVFRGQPIIEPGLTTAAVLPRGNLIAAGARYDWSLNRETTFAPRFEWRLSTSAEDESNTGLRMVGQSLRIGMDFRRTITRSLSGAVTAGYVSGFLRQAGDDIGMRGWRVSVQSEWRP